MILLRMPAESLAGTLMYIESEYSFLFEPEHPHELLKYAGDAGLASLAVGTLQVEIGVESRRALYVWGYHPSHNWALSRLDPPDAGSQAVLISPTPDLQPAVAIEVAQVGAWRTLYDPSSGWVRLAPDNDSDDWLAKIANGTVLGARGDELHSIWLQPVMA